MKKISVYDASDKRVQVDLVKYFKYNFTNYFIYTVNEMDDKGLIKLYVVKVMKELGTFISYNINDEDDWKLLQTIIKKILNEIKHKKAESFENLNTDCLNDIKIEDARFFKLDPNLVQILSDDANNYSLTSDEEKVLPTSDTTNTMGVKEKITEENTGEDYKTLYFGLQQEKEKLDKTLVKMLSEITEYRLKYGKIETSFNEDEETQEIDISIIEPTSDTDYKNLYFKLQQEKGKLDKILAKMLSEATEYRLKYGKLDI